MSRVVIEWSSSQSPESVGSVVFIDLFTPPPQNILEHKSGPDAHVLSTFVFRIVL